MLDHDEAAHVQKLMDALQEQLDLLQELRETGYTPELHSKINAHATHGYNAAWTPIQDTELLSLLWEHSRA